MQKAVALMLAAVAVLTFSGCAMIGTHSGPVEGGRKTTFGLLSMESVGNGYPMIPIYARFEQGAK